MEDFEAFYLKTRTRSSNKLDAVRLCFRQVAESWYDINKSDWDTFEGFREEFLGHFWAGTHREDRYKEISSPSRDVSMVDFFLGRLSIARSLILPRKESNIMADLMRLFPGEI